MFTAAYKRYVLAVMTTVYTFNIIDRGLMILLLQPIKQDLRLSDTQLGFLTGIAFGIFYATLGLPIARWADRGNRATIASLSIGLWGLTVMTCLFVTNYWQLVCARIAAAVGESGGKPPTYSLIGDYFPRPAERTRAMAIYWLSSPLAGLISFIAGGWLGERYGWRMTFFMIGIPGLILAMIVKRTITDPRTRACGAHVAQGPVPPMRVVLLTLWQQRACRHLSFGLILLYTIGLGLSSWYAAFLMRTHGMGTAELGVWLGLAFGLGGIAGVLLGGHVASRWFGDNERGQMRVTAVAVTLVVPCYVAFLLLPQKYVALAMLAPVMTLFNFFLAPTYALMQRLVPDEMRATTMAVVMLLANLIGMGIGPQVVGMLSDVFHPMLGIDSLRYAMLLMSVVALWAGWHFWKAGQTIKSDLSAVACALQPELASSTA